MLPHNDNTFGTPKDDVVFVKGSSNIGSSYTTESSIVLNRIASPLSQKKTNSKKQSFITKVELFIDSY